MVAFRDPKDALVSMYHFMAGWWLEPGAVSIGEFAEPWVARGDYFKHLVSWWNARAEPSVLLFSYEGMTADPASHVRRLAAFCGLPLDDALLALTLERSSIGYMLEHKGKFDDFLMREISERRCNLPSGSDSAKVRKGAVAAIAPSCRRRWAPRSTPNGPSSPRQRPDSRTTRG